MKWSIKISEMIYYKYEGGSLYGATSDLLEEIRDQISYHSIRIKSEYKKKISWAYVKEKLSNTAISDAVDQFSIEYPTTHVEYIDTNGSSGTLFVFSNQYDCDYLDKAVYFIKRNL